MSWLSNYFKGGENPADSAMPYLNQIPGVGHDAYDSYINQGKEMGGRLTGQYTNMTDDPTGFIDNIMKNYQTSDAYKFKQGELGRQLTNTQAAGGYVGTDYSQQQMGDLTHGLLSEDMQQYLQNALGVFGQGMKGEQDMYGKGYDASGKLADILGGNLGAQAGMAFQGTQQKNMNQQAAINALAKILSKGAGGSFGGGEGGAAGAAGEATGGVAASGLGDLATMLTSGIFL